MITEKTFIITNKELTKIYFKLLDQKGCVLLSNLLEELDAFEQNAFKQDAFEQDKNYLKPTCGAV